MEQTLIQEGVQFGRLIKFWRQKRRLSQIDLASMAGTTPRHMSFLETGRSRPKKELLQRLARALSLGMRDTNALLVSAGLAPDYAEYELNADPLKPYREAVDLVLKNHNPFPALAIDSVGAILTVNEAFDRFLPGSMSQSREDAIEAMFDPEGPIRDFIVNWEEMAWSWVDRQRLELLTSNNPRLGALVERAEKLLADVPRPEKPVSDPLGLVAPKFRFGDQIISVFTTLMRFENAADVTTSEVRVELMFPADEASRLFFENLAKNAGAFPVGE